MKNSIFFALLFLSIGFSASCEKDKEPSPIFTFSLAEADEGDDQNQVEMTITLDKASSKEATVDYALADGTAIANEDYLPGSGTLVFAPNETVAKLTISVVGDELREDDETIKVNFSNPKNAELPSTIATFLIRNDDTKLLIDPAGYSTPETYSGYNLNWADEFGGTSINTADWGYDLGDGCPNVCGWGNNELEYYTNSPKNVYLNDGFLVIEAIAESINGKNYSSSRMKTQGKKSFQYGRIDIRARMPKGQGVWPALWMLGDDITTAGWPACGEIDLMEHLGHESDKLYGTGHWGADVSQHGYLTGSITTTGANFNEEFHVFSLDWKEDEMVWLLDDQPYFTLTPANTGASNWAFNKPFFFIFNVAVGGNWPGNPDNTTTFPQRMLVDYVRVFDKV